MHINAYLRALRTYLGGAVRLRVSIDSFVPETQKALIEQHLFNALNELFAMFKYSDFANMECVMDSSATGHDYYEGFRFHIHAGGSDGRMFELADGGPVNWTQKLLSNAKERCVISGIGSERVCQIYNETRG
jgi:histidyl-tRNA synthetase